VVTVPQLPKPAPKPAPKSKAGLFVALGIVLVLVLAAGVGGFLIWNRLKSTAPSTTASAGNHVGATAAAPREISRYWLELEPTAAGGQPTRVAGLVPIASGQSFKFNFVFSENGYVYIFGPGDNNQPTAFLTTKPLPASGVTSNQVVGGRTFSFPSGAGNSLTLDKNPGTDSFTVVFAKSALPVPAFLNEPVTGQPLSAAQQAELKAFAAKYQEKAPVSELDESNAGAPSVRVKVPPEQNGNPIVFDIRIQHN
jgi:hypothetical protein